jgi:hypothetical protein
VGLNGRIRGILDAGLNGRRSRESDYGQPIAFGEDGNQRVSNALDRGTPCLVARLGASELRAVTYFTRWSWLRRMNVPYPRSVRTVMRRNAGFFPATDAGLDRFAGTFLDAISHTDVMAVWFNRNEHRIVRSYCPSASLIELGCLESMRFEHPWTAVLAAKTVLVIHPFARSIESQYRAHRRELFSNPDVLPEFELKTMASVQSIAGNTGGFGSWFDALDDMRDRIGREQFDIAIVGAGAYGLPLAAYVKSIGKQAVHMGGATQVLFGIAGRRWEEEYRDSIGAMINEHWVRPLPEETPERAATVEGGSYW